MDLGFIGLGNMGSRIVTMMLDAGHHVTVWARRPASLEPFTQTSDIAESAAGVGAASELVGICVWDEHDVDEVLLGGTGVLAGMQRGGIVAIHSTISPAACRRLHAEAARHGVDLVDAPVSAASNRAKMLVMIGGDANVVDRCRPAFDSFGDPVAHLGPVGSGQIAKIVNNLLLAATVGLAADAVAFGRDLDVDEAVLAKVLAAGSSGGTWSGLLSRRGGTTPQTLGGSGRTNEWARKDVGLALDLAADAGIEPGREILRLGARGVEVLDEA